MLVFARLAHGATLQQARVEMDAIARNLQDQNLIVNAGFGVNIFPIYLEDVGQQLRRNLFVLFAAVGLVLLISCANLSNLVPAVPPIANANLAFAKLSARVVETSSHSS